RAEAPDRRPPAGPGGGCRGCCRGPGRRWEVGRERPPLHLVLAFPPARAEGRALPGPRPRPDEQHSRGVRRRLPGRDEQVRGEAAMSRRGAPIALALDDKGAEFSPCRTYRYALWRIWDEQRPTVTWVMLNPSTADEQADDPTIRRVLGFTRAWGAGSAVIV